MKTPRPQPLGEYQKSNFLTLCRAFEDGNVALVSAVRKFDHANVALICAMGCDGDDILPTPFAVLIEGNPYELFYDPTEFKPSVETVDMQPEMGTKDPESIDESRTDSANDTEGAKSIGSQKGKEEILEK